MYTYFQLQRSSFLIFPLSRLWKESNFPPLALMKGHFHISLVQNYTVLHHLSPKVSGEYPQTPLPDTFTTSKLPCDLRDCVKGLAIVQKVLPLAPPPPPPPITKYTADLYINHTSSEVNDDHNPPFSPLLFCPSKLLESWTPPWRKFLYPRLFIFLCVL